MILPNVLTFHPMLGKSGLMASHTEEVLPFKKEASSLGDLPAVAAGEGVFVPDGPLVLPI